MEARAPLREKIFAPISGWAGVLMFVVIAAVFLRILVPEGPQSALEIWLLVGAAVLMALIPPGFFLVNPNQSRVLILFGRYRGTVRRDGFFWTNPFTVKKSVSLRAHNIASQKIKVNDLIGNPIEIGAVVVWQVQDTAQATFDVEDYRQYVDVQIETALRHLANSHPYDEGQAREDIPSLRGDVTLVAELLRGELQARLDRAGILVLEARLSHLAYAPEIASAMLQRQQATAIIAARQKIVEGAVSMVEMALAELTAKNVVHLDDERRATMVGNLLVVLCSHHEATPVLNTGSLYT